MPLTTGQTLSHYRLEGIVGEGGMGVVWRATDTVLERTVAIKVLRSDATSDADRRELFLQEARLASVVSAAHVVQVYEFGQAEGVDFIVMEYIDGRTLREIMKRGPLPATTVVDWGYQVSHALSRAHRKGLVHRDIKPSNIKVTDDDEVKVLDFGLAKLFEPDDSSIGSTVVTLPAGVPRAPGEDEREVVGTVPYMSPEQVRGDEVDARSDIFSLGVVLYEMATGQRPFGGSRRAILMRNILDTRLAPVGDLVPDASQELVRIIHKCLAARRSDRYQTIQDLAVDLRSLGRDLESDASGPRLDSSQVRPERDGRRRRVVSVVLAVVAAALVGAGALFALLARPTSVLVLPMSVHGQEEGAEFLGQAFSEALAIDLTEADALRILPVPQAGTYDDSDRVAAARRLDGDFLVNGILTRDAAGIHVSVSLVEVADNRVVWGVQKRGAASDLSGLAVTLAREIAGRLGAGFPTMYDYIENLTGGPAMAASPESAEAIGALRRDDVPAALAATERLVARFPDEPDAAALRAAALNLKFFYEPQPKNRGRLESAIERLEELDPETPYGPMMRVSLMYNAGTPPRDLADHYSRVLERTNLTGTARAWVLRRRASMHAWAGDFPSALADLEAAVQLDPAQPENLKVLSDTFYKAGRLEEALMRAQQAVALNPLSWIIHEKLGHILLGLERLEDASAAFGKACDLNRFQSPCSLRALALLESGQTDDALRTARRAGTMPATAIGAWNLAVFWLMRDDRHRALQWLRRSVDLGMPVEQVLGDDAASVRDDPAALLEKIESDLEKRRPFGHN